MICGVASTTPGALDIPASYDLVITAIRKASSVGGGSAAVAD
jgi:hypothetical protein